MQNPLDISDISAAEKIRSRMDDRRDMMNRQIIADEIKSKLCNDIAEFKASKPGLKERIRVLEIDDNELFHYIRRLEFVQDGIWCNSCNAAKTIHNKIDGDMQGAAIDDTPLQIIENSSTDSSTDPELESLLYDKYNDEFDRKFMEDVDSAEGQFNEDNHGQMAADLLRDKTIYEQRAAHRDHFNKQEFARISIDEDENLSNHAAKFEECFRRISALEARLDSMNTDPQIPSNTMADLIAEHSSGQLTRSEPMPITEYDFTESIETQYKSLRDAEIHALSEALLSDPSIITADDLL